MRADKKKEREKERRKEPKMCEYYVCCDSELNYSSIAQYNFSCRLSRLQKLKRPVKNKIYKFFFYLTKNNTENIHFKFQLWEVKTWRAQVINEEQKKRLWTLTKYNKIYKKKYLRNFRRKNYQWFSRKSFNIQPLSWGCQ